MSEHTAIINGVILTEDQLREGLAQVEAQKDKRLYVSPSLMSPAGVLNVPIVVVQQMAAQAKRLGSSAYVVLYPNGDVGFNHRRYGNFEPLRGFTS